MLPFRAMAAAMKALQVVVFIVTGCAAIYGGLTGYSVALVSVLAAFVVTVIIPEAFASIRGLATKKRGNGGAD